MQVHENEKKIIKEIQYSKEPPEVHILLQITEKALKSHLPKFSNFGKHSCILEVWDLALFNSTERILMIRHQSLDVRQMT